MQPAPVVRFHRNFAKLGDLRTRLKIGAGLKLGRSHVSSGPSPDGTHKFRKLGVRSSDRAPSASAPQFSHARATAPAPIWVAGSLSAPFLLPSSRNFSLILSIARADLFLSCWRLSQPPSLPPRDGVWKSSSFLRKRFGRGLCHQTPAPSPCQPPLGRGFSADPLFFRDSSIGRLPIASPACPIGSKGGHQAAFWSFLNKSLATTGPPPYNTERT